jgi:aspartyl-tRNA(Asn)/glutamyl-tRNA(Gln) amidotransferase subunit C
MSSSITQTQVAHIAQLANIPVSDAQAATLTTAFAETLKVIENLQQCDVSNVQPTHQVTGLENVTRTDEVDHDRMFTQKEALQNAAQTHNGYFVVPQILTAKDGGEA